MKITIALILLNTMITIGYAHSRAYPDSLLAMEYKKKAIDFLEKEKWDSAQLYKSQAIAIFSKNNDLYNWAYLYRELGWEYRNQGNYSSALQQFKLAMDIRQKKLSEKKEYKQLAWIYCDIGYTHKSNNNLLGVVENYDIALRIFRDTLQIEDKDVAIYIYSELGNAHNRLRDYDEAAREHQRRINILFKAKEWDALAGGYNDLAKVYENKEDYPKAIRVYEEGLRVKEMGFSNRVTLLFNIGYTYLLAGDHHNALKYTRECEDIIHNANLSEAQKAEYLVWVYENLAAYFKEKGDFLTSEKYYDLFIRNIRIASPNSRRNLALAYLSKANMLLDWGKPKIALDYFYQVLQLFLTDFQPQTPYDLPREEQLTAEPNLIETFGGMAQAFAILKALEPNDGLYLTSKCLDLATNVEALLLQLYTLEGSKLTALQEHRWIKFEHIDFLYEKWGKQPNRELAKDIFNLSEKSRALLLLEGVDINNTLASEEVEDLRSSHNNLNQKIGELEQWLYEKKEASEDTIASMEHQLEKAQKEKAKLLKKVKGLKGNLANLDNLANIQTTKSILGKDEALIEFFIHETAAFIFIIPPGNAEIQIVKTTWDNKLADMASTIANDIFLRNNEAYVRKARVLFDHLIKPVLEHTSANHLTIVPDGVLWNVPFDALLTNDIPAGKMSNFKNYPYLIQKRRISYAFSATMQQRMVRPDKLPEGDIIVFAPSYRKIEYPLAMNRSKLDSLIHNLDEAKAVADICGGRLIPGRVATKGQFLQILKEVRVLHFGGHAKADSNNPGFSFLAFTNLGDTLNEPFKLYAHELYNHPRPMDMVVLSACETGIGPVWKGEGAISIARAFAHGGARSIITTLWKVDDHATRQIMTQFYQKLLNRPWCGKEEALRQAKLSYLQSDSVDHDRAHPVYWAAFTPIGDMRPEHFGYFWWKWIVAGCILAGLLILTGVVFFRKNRKRKKLSASQ